MKQKEEYMARALELARQGMGHTSPNPMVGCVVVKDGRIVSEGYHERYGEYHAERNALLHCEEDVTGAELYVTLEPCCHQGKTPPCTDIIMERKIGKVYVGSMDPNPLVGGKGVQLLRDHGIEVETGILEKECLELNEIFFHYIQTNLPLVAVKYAMTLDGRIASASGDSKWITKEKAREHVHELRKQYKAIMAGIGTVLADDPMLNCRICEGVDPIRVICDSKLRIPMDAQIVKTAHEIPTMIYAAAGADGKKKAQLEKAGIRVIVQEQETQVNLKKVIQSLGEEKIDSVLVEGGGEIHGSLIKEGLADKVYAYIAPKIIGGSKAKGPVMGEGIRKMSQAAQLTDVRMHEFDGDYMIEGTIKKAR
ncbi:bifunctional diaminohydroxyphosphoribosylaminopyrimidine deaminase/5-amino-6-(5-phosphoribosylamino)uracil reductase RibD [Eubacterium oxidoreducens]|uniref:Riboflavin biosynthesis protein RibD n=1 Tax=Eubacterium oxidoreducens TaxID=1732 RepID=A0A1G6CK92_EUBOX|nr:bifunctional diaminohydroxyphosphoribosylaminopyrimidine deaminase/5-amino-6-(5-phosphoribosylamino)uracil reductase RibD [Eubacterium oxidoreducens]SDB33279.1 diaminohydroxyphosphoribosylaminopyrimidine deaminase [Eubacterium oxidoreducens]